ncbi:LLM class flavin-dependent oxidoreductase [Planctomicrobium sp. SH661]|uniref:LLM class flavin-dependent oxidoreductase n=1 Tax=Planctomicrobium sp. SH661 TaxID=3448124 RepID=UPI003F5CB440
MIPISVLELGRIREGNDRRAPLDEARRLAQHAERLGYRRFWVAEHHNIRSVSTAATSIVIAHVAAGTKTIRVGAGGIMLPNHAPYIIAEQFGTLATLFPDRIDLGLGRAPGTDQATLRALRRDPRNAENFPQDVLELQAFLDPPEPGQRIEAIPGSGTKVPLWILGSSLFGAQLAAELGLPYGFASHFAPQALDQALRIYRERFKPSLQQETSYAIVGVNIIAAESDEEARHLATSQQMSFADLVQNQPSLLRPPIDDIENYWSPQAKFQASQMLACSIIGGPDTVRAGMNALIERTGADELMIVSDIFDSEKRFRSFEIIAEVTGSHEPV